jgi:hypothetical protein
MALAGAIGAAVPTGLQAASPGPSASALVDGRPERPPIEVWLDGPVPSDLAPGDPFDVGATLWDRVGQELPRMGATIFLRVQPATGSGAPVQVFARSDWPGHYRGSAEVPEGGLGSLELGVTGTICENDVCRPDDWVFPIAGEGPPPEAPITALADARIDLASADVAAGQPVEVTVSLTPKAGWGSLRLPEEIVVRAHEARGPNAAVAPLGLRDRANLTYAGSLTIPQAGELVLEAALDEDGGDATRFGTSMIQVRVGEGDGTPGSVSGRGPAADDGPPILLLVLLAVVAFVGAAVVLAGFRAGSR